MAEKMNNLSGSEWFQNSFSIWNKINKTKEERKLKHPAMFPQKLPEKLINIYTRNKGELVLDPFMGIGSTLLASINCGVRSVGLDLNKTYVTKVKKRVKSFQKDLFNKRKIYEPKIYCDDAKNISKYIKNESLDLVITSPPYWNILNQKRTADNKEIRKYSNAKKDLGNINDYEKFLDELKIVFKKTYEKLKFNKRCISIVMDIRKKDKFYPLHEDQTRIMKEIGFELEEYIIWDRSIDYNNMTTLGFPWVFRVNKVHEFICIYWKR